MLTKLKASGHRVLIFSQMVKLLNILEASESNLPWTASESEEIFHFTSCAIAIVLFRFTSRFFFRYVVGFSFAWMGEHRVKIGYVDCRYLTNLNLHTLYFSCLRKLVAWALTYKQPIQLLFMIRTGTPKMTNKPNPGELYGNDKRDESSLKGHEWSR